MLTPPRIAAGTIVLGLVGIGFTALGWQTNAASPAFFLGGSLVAFMWGIIMIVYYRIAARHRSSSMLKTKNALGFQGAPLVIQLALFIGGLASISGQSSWLYVSFGALVLAEVLMATWPHAIASSVRTPC